MWDWSHENQRSASSLSVCLVVIPIGIGGLGYVDVGSFAYSVLTGVCTTDFYVASIAAVVTVDACSRLSWRDG